MWNSLKIYRLLPKKKVSHRKNNKSPPVNTLQKAPLLLNSDRLSDFGSASTADAKILPLLNAPFCLT
jgi:hypothetical protein